MMRTVGSWSHGICDYVFVVLLAIGPGFAGFAGRQATWCYVIAAILFALAVLTRYPLGVMKHLNFASHGAVELVLIGFLFALPWVANFANGVHSRNFYVAMALLMLAVWLLTDFRGVRGRVAKSAASVDIATP